MSTLRELIDAGKEHRVTFRNSEGKQLFELSVLWAVIIAIASPPALVLVLVLLLLDVIIVELDGSPLGLVQKE